MILARAGPHGPVVHAADAAAAGRGVRLGARVVDARAIHPDLRVEPADPEGDAAALSALAIWARRWCPWTAPDGADGLVLDVTGSAHLRGGEAALLAEVEARLAALGYGARAAIAPTPGAARALARHGEARAICGPEELAARLAPLPARALGLDEAIGRLLDRLGLRTIGDLAAIPRAALARRFAQVSAETGPLTRLDRAMGRSPEPVDGPAEPRRFAASARLAEPVTDAEPHLPGLARDLCEALAGAGRGARRLRLTVHRADGGRRAAEVATARASRDPAHLARLVAGRLDRIDPGLGFDAIVLEAPRTEPLAAAQPGLDGAREAEGDLAALIDRLTARLGRGAVAWSTWRESHVPERFEARAPAIAAAPAAPPDLPRERPIRLLDPAEEIRVLYALPEGPPGRFVWRRVTFDVTRRQGPERIAPEWWRDRPGTRLRDYYKVEVADGRRFWIYREGLSGDGRGGAPRWLLHGFFA